MLKIRLKRVGRKNDPYYRIVVMESSQPRDGRTKDEIGIYNPRLNQFDVDVEKAKTWLENGAQPSDTVAQYFVKAGILKELKRGSTKPSTKKKDKKQEE
jgi:small subunit ribosomal protein S16